MDLNLRMKHIILGNYLETCGQDKPIVWATIHFLYRHSDLLSQVIFVPEGKALPMSLIISAPDNQILFQQSGRVYDQYEAALCAFCAYALEEPVPVCLLFADNPPIWYQELTQNLALKAADGSTDYRELHRQAELVLIDESLDRRDRKRFMLLTANLQRVGGFQVNSIE